MNELLEVVAEATRSVGAVASVHVGAYPVLPQPCVYVVIPHEYFVLTRLNAQPSAEQRARTVGFCVEHPGNLSFEIGARHAATLGAVMDINDDSTSALRAGGLAAHRFTLGYSSRWDVWRGDQRAERPIDITYLGTTDVRRDNLLARQSEQLSTADCRLLIPPHEWMAKPRPDFLMGTAKLRHLAGSKVLLNLHRGRSRALEWVRVLEAICNGCVVVSESSLDFMPLLPGRHIALAHPTNTVAVATALLRHPDRLAAMRNEAYGFCQTLDMQTSARTLVEIGESLVRRHAKVPSIDPAGEAAGRVTRPAADLLPPAHGLPELSDAWATVAQPVREAQARLIEAILVDSSAAEITLPTMDTASPPRVRALMPLGIDDRAASGITSRSLETQEVPVALSTARPSGQRSSLFPRDLFSRGALLNALLEHVSEPFVLVIEPGNELFGPGVRRLLTALEEDPTADASFGIMADVSGGVLWNALPVEAERLARRAYLSAPFLIRRQVLAALGAFADDVALIGYEYHDFWCRFALSKRRAVFVQQIVGRGRPTAVPEVSIARTAPHLTLAALHRSATRRPVSAARR